MRFICRVSLSRMTRQKTRLLFVLLAIAASSCLIVWTIGGFQALFIDASTEEGAFLGRYDLQIAAPSVPSIFNSAGGGPKFDGPLSRKNNESNAAPENAQGRKNAEPAKTNAAASAEPQNGQGGAGMGGRGQGGPGMGGRGQGGPGMGGRGQGGPGMGGRGQGGPGMGGMAQGGPGMGGRGQGGPGMGGRGGMGGMMGGRGGAPALVFSKELIADLRADEDVSLCDEVSNLRMFVYSPGETKSILEDDDPEEDGDKPTWKRSLDISDEELAKIGEAPEGIDPELHRQALGAYRATMGTPLGFGSTFQATTALEAPYDLEDGRWFNVGAADAPQPREAVVTKRGNERLKTKVGDSILLLDKASLIGKTTEYQLKVVGIVEDSEHDGFYISRALAEELSTNAEVQTNAVMLKLRGGVDAFRARWSQRLAADVPTAECVTDKELADRRAAAFKNDQAFKYQAASGTLLAALAALFIVFTALNMSVDEQKRLIAFYRVSGLTRSQVSLSILMEAIMLAAPGWLAGMASGWVLVLVCSGRATGLNLETVGFSFVCTFIGAVLAALYPIFRSARVKPFDAINEPEKRFLTGKARRRQTTLYCIAALFGAACVCGDLWIVYHLEGTTARKAALHSGLGVLLLSVGVVGILPLAIRALEAVLLPILAFVLRFDRRVLSREFSGNAGRAIAVCIALSVGGGLFVTMQIWGYSMLDPFLPGRREPDAFAAFLPNGLRPEIVDELKALPMVDENSFLPIAVEQAAFAEGSVPEDARKSQFANVVFFGVDIAKAFEGDQPLVGMRFRQGDPEQAWAAMKSGRGVVVTDSLSVDYKLNLGDTLKVVHPRDPEKTLEYPIVGVVSFPGWQWLSKTGGVRRNFGRSGGIVFAREGIVANDYQLDRRSYFWFNSKDGKPVDYSATEFACDILARKNLRLDLMEPTAAKGQEKTDALTAYVKLSTRESLTASISNRADSVIWGLSKTPLTTLIVASIAVIGAIANSVRARRWQFGVMRAVGMTRWAMVRSILAEGALIGVAASFASFAFGFLAAQGALKLGQSMFGSFDPPLILPVKGLSVGFGLTVALCLAAAVYPAVKAAMTEPLKLLQSGRSPD